MAQLIRAVNTGFRFKKIPALAAPISLTPIFHKTKDNIDGKILIYITAMKAKVLIFKYETPLFMAKGNRITADKSPDTPVDVMGEHLSASCLSLNTPSMI